MENVMDNVKDKGRIKSPVIFAGHGSPMNAIEKNEITDCWKRIGEELVAPEAFLVVSAHWYTDGTFVQKNVDPEIIYDMYGFPKELYELRYPAAGSLRLSEDVERILGEDVSVNNDWGIDHGTWSVMTHMIPDGSVPLVQLSIDFRKSFEEHWRIGESLKKLREMGYGIFCSGNIVHNLRLVEWENPGISQEGREFDDYIHGIIMSGDYRKVLEAPSHPYFRYAVPTPDHFIPLIYFLASLGEDDRITDFNRTGVLGTMSMTGYRNYGNPR